MTLTLATARFTVLDHLDDDNTRWSEAQVDRALSYALSQTLFDYASGGGDRFDVTEALSTTAGSLSLATRVPILIRGVSLLVGQRYFPLTQRPIEDRSITDDQTRSLQVRYVRAYALPTDSTHPLVGVGATPALSWDGFDHWVCLRAAMFASTKDAELRNELVDQEARAASSVMTIAKTPTALPFPARLRYYSQILVWTWQRDTQTLILTRRW